MSNKKKEKKYYVKRMDEGSNWVHCGTYNDDKAAFEAANRERSRSGRSVRVLHGDLTIYSS